MQGIEMIRLAYEGLFGSRVQARLTRLLGGQSNPGQGCST